MTYSSDSHKLPVRGRSAGFALVVTLSLMILLTLVAVGLLGLSAVSLRSSTQVMAQAEAQANARVALMLAIGELQKELGPDRAITATSEILATPTAAVAKPNTTGVWKSWSDFNPNSSNPLNYTDEKTNRFRGWLVSSADFAAPRSRNFVTTGWTGKTISLVDKGSLGASAPATAKVTVGLVPVSKNSKVQGSYAWHVSDESVKARINAYRDPGQNATLAQKRALLAGHRPDPSVMRGPDGNLLTCLPTDLTTAELATATATVGKVIDLDQAELIIQPLTNQAAKGKIKPLRNDITPYSLGVLSDVRGGGLKQDLSSMFELGDANNNTLPTDFTGNDSQYLYRSTHGITGISDPKWSALAGYYNSFRNLTAPDSNPAFALKQGAGSTVPVPATYNLAPVIAKVDTIFSLVGRPVSEFGWIDKKPNDYFVDLIFTPVVTLHNPYNVSISFQVMNVAFHNVPIAFNFMLQKEGVGAFVSQSVVPGTFESLNTMLGHVPSRGVKKFEMYIANWSDTNPYPTGTNPPTPPISGPIIMKPGQTMVCGPSFDPNGSFWNDTRGGSVAFDWQNQLTNAIKGKPSFTPGLGFETVAVNISNMTSNNDWKSFLMVRDQGAIPKISESTVTDKFYVEFQAQRPSWYPSSDPVSRTNKTDLDPPSFAVTAKLQATSGEDINTLPFYVNLQFNYPDDATLKNVFNNRVYRYPPTDSLTGSQVAAPLAVLYSAQGPHVHPFAIFSAYARSTNGGVYETGSRTQSPNPGNSPQLNLLKDGRLAGKPFLFHNPSRSNFTMNLASDKPGAQAYELNLQPFLSKGDYEGYMDVDSSNRTPSLTGNKTTSGIKSGSYFELPSGPLQTIADFRRSNALTTTYLPHFVQPVANSLLHPLMSPDKVIETNANITATTMLDHSVLANHALYDRFYFSTFATRGNVTPDAVFEQFMNGTAPLASQAFQPYRPGGTTVAAAKAELFTGAKPKNAAYKTAAEYQMIRGPFNVNSISVQAWKAVLATMNKSDITTLWAKFEIPLTAQSPHPPLETRKAGGVAITAMSLPNGGAIPGTSVDASKIDNEKTNKWNGYRELTEPELETLAIKIVEEVRARGPFLSMSEFVNRQIGPSGPLTLSGALEAAIAKSEINEKQNATSADSFLSQVPITATNISDPLVYNYKTPEATIGNPAAGAPGWVNQGDLLRILEPSATVRGDTFVIRSYGEAQDASGNITARAYAEAVVQRIPEYVDPTDRPSLNAATDPAAKTANFRFGRRFNMVSFRWLSKEEI